MNQAEFIFYGELNDFLQHDQRERPIWLTFGDRQSVKHLFESLGVPHTEVGQVKAVGIEKDFSYLVQDGDKIEVSPFEQDQLDLTVAPERAAFLLDLHLGKLARMLRILGFDTWYRNDYEDEELVELAASGKRILLTRDRRMLMNRRVQWGYCVRSLIPREQAAEIIRRYHLQQMITPFRRCSHCNTVLAPEKKERLLDRLEPLTRQYFDEFHICPNCGQIYWKGSHFERLEEFIRQSGGG